MTSSVTVRPSTEAGAVVLHAFGPRTMVVVGLSPVQAVALRDSIDALLSPNANERPLSRSLAQSESEFGWVDHPSLASSPTRITESLS